LQGTPHHTIVRRADPVAENHRLSWLLAVAFGVVTKSPE
jgi:hypothetical protein